jgi:DNA polymerase III epsilon subunit-like protein
MARWHYDENVRTPDEKTELNWLKSGYVVMRGRKGVLKYTNGFCQQMAVYYSPNDVREDSEKAATRLNKLHEEDLRRRRKARREKKLMQQRKVAEWSRFLRQQSRIIVFDCETSGLDSGWNVILSLSWQVLDRKLRKLDEQTFYFEWPKDPDMVSEGAIEVNGLTRERLAQLGTSSKADALRIFAAAVKEASLLVAHNGSFDRSFVLADAAHEGVPLDMGIPMWDTMIRMTQYCAIPRYEYGREYKWPKLMELAEIINVDTGDIDWHLSASDVEVTVRCFRKIAEKGLVNV